MVYCCPLYLLLPPTFVLLQFFSLIQTSVSNESRLLHNLRDLQYISFKISHSPPGSYFSVLQQTLKLFYVLLKVQRSGENFGKDLIPELFCKRTKSKRKTHLNTTWLYTAECRDESVKVITEKQEAGVCHCL